MRFYFIFNGKLLLFWFFFSSEEAGDCIKPICWENYLAQELYKLTVTDFVVQTGLIFFVGRIQNNCIA